MSSAAVALAPAESSPLPIQLVVRRTHVIQPLVHLSIFLYWGLYWSDVRSFMPRLLDLCLFAYAIDAIFSFARYKSWRIGLGPLPIVFSSNLFVWFDGRGWYWHYVLLAIGIACKHFVQRDGRHVFNPSAIGISVLAIPCLLFPHRLGEVDVGHPIAAAPNMAEWILLVSLISLRIVPVVLTTIGAVLINPPFSGLIERTIHTHPYTPGVPWAPILLGLTLLITDPATTPRKPVGQLLFGAVYMMLFAIIGTMLNAPTEGTDTLNFWAKVLPIPIVNWLVPWFDRIGDKLVPRPPRWLGPEYNGRHVLVWAVVMSIGMMLTPQFKRRHFDNNAMCWAQTAHVVVDGDGKATCEQNPVFCRPFSFAGEIALWTGRGPAPRNR